MTDDLDRRIRDALQAKASQLTDDTLNPGVAPSGSARWSERHRWGMPVLAAAAVAALAVGTTVAVDATRSDGSRVAVRPPIGTASTAAAPATSTATTSAAPTSTAPSSSTPSSTVPSGSTATAPPATFALGYQPLWPFGDYAEARAWQVGAPTTGAQPWHLDPGQTALGFARGYLGFTELTRVTGTRSGSDGAHVGVGYHDPNGIAHTAAIVHLVRFGVGQNAGWEVVGTDDTTLSVEQPAYGSQVTSPLSVGGHITGVDEAIVLSVLSLRAGVVNRPVTPLPAGGSNTPWSRQVQFTGSGVLTIVAYTGGHLQQVERFAVQGVHT